jgi:DNA-binding GntR family transcriptional regulator
MERVDSGAPRQHKAVMPPRRARTPIAPPRSGIDLPRPDAPAPLVALVSIPEQIASALGDAILAGDYQPGEAIPEQRLSDRFRVSRGPVREALRILEREGVVAIVPRHGARVTKLSVDEVAEIYEIRATLFGLAARLFAERRPDPAVAQLRSHLAALASIAATGIEERTAQHARLSATMAQVITGNCGNRRLAGMVHQMARQVARYTVLGLSSEERHRQSIAGWRRIVAAAAGREAAAAGDTAREMVLNTLAHAVRTLRAGPETR